MNVRIIKHEDLEKSKWDGCIHYANRGNAYGYWWYLSNTVKEWDAVVEGDYETVFPLIPKGGNTLTTPTVIPELGIYSIHILSEKRVSAILNAIPYAYRSYDFILNLGVTWPSDIAIDKNIVYNYQMFMGRSYDEIEQGYSGYVHTQFDKARTHRLIVNSNIKPEKIAEFYREHTSDKTNIEADFHTYQRIMYNAMHRGIGFASAILSQEGEYLAVGFFIFSHGKIMRLISEVSPSGKERGAEVLMFDMLVRGNEGKSVILDFNDFSDDALAAHFGATKVPQYRVKK